MLSAAGPTAGSSLIAPLNLPGVHYSDRQWTEALRWRLGVLAPAHGTCKNERLDERVCGEALDDGGDHAVECSIGPLRNFRHNDIADIYVDIFEEIGAVARREVFVPEFSTAGVEAWLDVWAHGVPEVPDALLDITVRHPRADRYQPAAARVAGHAAAQAEREKFVTYPPAGGRSIIAVAHETWGRLGEQAEQLLAACNAAATRQAYRRGRLPGNSLRRWRAQLDAALHRGIASQLVSARCGLPGRRRRRVAPIDVAVLETRCPL